MPKQKDLISDDATRCTNHRCSKNLACKRYVQMKIDYLYKGVKAGSNNIFSYTRFESKSCTNFKNF